MVKLNDNKITAPRFMKKGQLPVNEKKQWKAIRDRVAFREYKGLRKNSEIASINTTSKSYDPVTGDEVNVKTIEKKVPKKNIKLNPYHKELNEFKGKKLVADAERQRKRVEIEEKKIKLDENLKIKQKSNVKLSKRTPRGQPIMRNVVSHLFSKIKDKQAKGLL